MVAGISSVPRFYDPPGQYDPYMENSETRSRVLQQSRSVSSLHPVRPDTLPVVDNQLAEGSTVSGWTRELIFAFINGILSFLWGIALAIFTTGVVQVTYYLERLSNHHPGVKNVITTTVAALCTMHTKSVLTKTIELYATHALHQGFTMRSLRRMQGMMEWSPLTPLKPLQRGSPIWKVGWAVVYIGMALHTASIVAILQTVTYNLEDYQGDPIPCGISPDSLTLAPVPNVPTDVVQKMDQLSHETALGLSNYYERIISNETSSFMGRVYLKDEFAYSATGYGFNSKHDYPGLMFEAKCSPTVNITDDTALVSSLWLSTFPSRKFPTVKTDSGQISFVDDPVTDPNLQALASASLTGTGSVLQNKATEMVYSLVKSSGDGGILVVDVSGQLFGCTWTASPVLVNAVMFGLVYRTAGYDIPGDFVAAPASRAVLTTVQGIVHAVELGATVQFSGPIYNRWDSNAYNSRTGPPKTQVMLQTLLGDGGKAAMTVYTSYLSPILASGKGVPDGITACNSNNTFLIEHWNFGNQNNLGWIAILWTIGAGLFSIIVIFRLQRQTRVVKVDGFNVVTLFKLGVSSAGTVGLDVEKDRELCLRGGRLVDKRLLPVNPSQYTSPVDEKESFLGYSTSA